MHDRGQEAVAAALAEIVVGDRLIENGREFAISWNGVAAETGDCTCTVTRGWNFWREQMTVIVKNARDSTEYECCRPAASPKGTPWSCRDDAGSSPILVRLDRTEDSAGIGNRLTAAFRQTRWLEQDFNASSNVILRIDDYEDCRGLRCNNDVSLGPSPDGFTLHSKGESPIVILPKFSWTEDTFPILKVEITSPAPSFVEIFFLRKDQKNYSASQRLYRSVAKGPNVLYFSLPGADPHSLLRLDPGNAACTYVVRSIEARAVPR